jgi:hypothetical protein
MERRGRTSSGQQPAWSPFRCHDQQLKLKRIGTPKDVTGVVAFLASDAARWEPVFPLMVVQAVIGMVGKASDCPYAGNCWPARFQAVSPDKRSRDPPTL